MRLRMLDRASVLPQPHPLHYSRCPEPGCSPTSTQRRRSCREASPAVTYPRFAGIFATWRSSDNDVVLLIVVLPFRLRTRQRSRG